MHPYQDLEQKDNYVIRNFDENINPTELLWHRDEEDRLVEVLECGDGWKFQHDNRLPQDLNPSTSISIQKYKWHRLIKGEGNLLLKIHKS